MGRFRRLGVVLAVTSALASMGGPALAHGTVPVHTVQVECLGPAINVKVLALGTVTYPQLEWVAWQGWLQKQMGSYWATVPGSASGWQYFQTYDAQLLDLPGGLLDMGWDVGEEGTYRVVSRFYWYRTGAYSPWEFSDRSCYAFPLIVI